jgi:hypothetical protein
VGTPSQDEARNVKPLAAGDKKVAPVPSPSSPRELYPHAHTVPSGFNANEWDAPAATAASPVSPLTCTAVVLCVVVPSPNCPLPLYPHAHTVPSVFNANEWDAPAATAATPVSPLTCTAVVLCVVVPSPNCP